MTSKKSIFAIIGSASNHSSNLQLVKLLEKKYPEFHWNIFNELRSLPHFQPEHSIENTPAEVLYLRTQINLSDIVLISTPEYVFSIPSGLKNALEWCVSTTIFENKPVAIITASSKGEKGKEELELILNTVGAKFNKKSSILISGIKGKIDVDGILTDADTIRQLDEFMKEIGD